MNLLISGNATLGWRAVLWIICCPIFLIAQNYSISGKLLNEQKEAVSFASISLLHTVDSSFVKGTLTDDKGKFTLDAIAQGSYLLEVRDLRYQTSMIPVQLDQPTNLDIVLESSAVDLETVTVKAERSKLQSGIDIHTINVDKSALGQGGTALEVIKSSPLISVTPEGDVAMRGRSDLQIQINGKPSGFASLQGAVFLDQIDAGAIEKIEIITNPSASESAQGGAGIINIVLKKGAQQGINGSLQAFVGNGNRYGLIPSINYRFNKLNLFTNYSLRSNTRATATEQSRTQTLPGMIETIAQIGQSARDELRHNVDFGADYFFSEDTYLTLSGLYRTRQKELEQTLTSHIFQESQLVENRSSTIAEPESNEGLGINLNFLSKKGDKNEVAGFFEYIFSEEDETIQRIDEISNASFAGGLTQYVDINQRIITDFSLSKPLGESSFYDVGVRWVYRDIEQDFSYRLVDSLTGSVQDAFFQQDQFFYQDNIFSAYLLLEKQFKKWKMELGLRGEQLINNYRTNSIPDNFSRNYFNLFPSIQLHYSPGEASQFKFAYSRKFNLPSPNRLNPFVNISQPFRTAEGNPNLRPEFINSLELSYLRFWERVSLNTNVFYKQYSDLIQRISILEDNGNQLVTPINLDELANYGIDASLSWAVSPNWDLQTGFLWYENKFSSTEISDLSGSSYQIKLNSELQLFESWKIELLGVYQSRETTAQGINLAQYFIDFGFQKTFSEAFTITLSLSDILNTLEKRSELRTANLSIDNTTKIDTRRIRLNVRYKF